MTTVGKANIVGAQAAKAVSVLKEFGWIVGPSPDPEAWRSAVRAEARRADVRIRTGAARRVDGVFPWAVTTEFFETIRSAMGGTTPATLGGVLVDADAYREDGTSAPADWPIMLPQPPPPSQA